MIPLLPWILLPFILLVAACGTAPDGNDAGSTNTPDADGTIAPDAGEEVLAGPPTITRISPLQGPVGTRVEIDGTNFSVEKTSNSVSFGGTGALVVQASPTQLAVLVPENGVSGHITIRTAAGTVESTEFFAIGEAPLVTGYFPSAEARVGDPLTIAGEHFSDDADQLSVTFLGGEGGGDDVAAATPYSAGTTSFSVSVPEGAKSGPLRIVAEGRSAVTSLPVVVLETVLLQVLSVPAEVRVAAPSFTVTGAGFSTTAAENTVAYLPLFGGSEVAATVQSATADTLVLTPPSELGLYSLRVRAGGQEATAANRIAFYDLAYVTAAGRGAPGPGGVDTSAGDLVQVNFSPAIAVGGSYLVELLDDAGAVIHSQQGIDPLMGGAGVYAIKTAAWTGPAGSYYVRFRFATFAAPDAWRYSTPGASKVTVVGE